MAKTPTKTRVTKPPTKTGVSTIDNLDLRKIVDGVRKDRRWSSKTARDAEIWYRLFLAMTKKRMRKGKRRGIKVTAAFGLEEVSDYIWHEHIVNTKRYRKDCEKIFGKGEFLDHTPVRPKNWRVRLSKSMKEYDAAFGIHPPNARICCI